MKRKIYLPESLNRDAFVLVRGVIFGARHELVSVEDPPKSGVNWLDWADLFVLLLPCPALSIVHCGMAIGKGIPTLICDQNGLPMGPLLKPYVPDERFFTNLEKLAEFLKFESDVPF